MYFCRGFLNLKELTQKNEDKVFVLKGFLFYLSKYFVKRKIYLLLHPMKIVPNKLLTTIMICLTGMFTLTSLASDGSVNQNPPPPTPPPPGLPIDGGLVILLCAGLLFAYYKFTTYQNTKKTLK